MLPCHSFSNFCHFAGRAIVKTGSKSPSEEPDKMAQTGRENLSSELVYQGPLIGMKETKTKEEKEKALQKKPAVGEKRIPAETVR